MNNIRLTRHEIFANTKAKIMTGLIFASIYTALMLFVATQHAWYSLDALVGAVGLLGLLFKKRWLVAIWGIALICGVIINFISHNWIGMASQGLFLVFAYLGFMGVGELLAFRIQLNSDLLDEKQPADQSLD